MSKYKYRASGISDIGLVKKHNEDAYVLKAAISDAEQVLFALVADGMGGLANGDIASLVIKCAFEDWFLTKLPELLKSQDFEDELAAQWQSIIVAENEVLNKGESASGTTLTALLLYGGKFYTANIGDSRIYRLNRGTLYQLTVDHSWVQEALKAGLAPEEIERDPRKNTLTRCIGASLTNNPDTDYTSGFYTCGDTFLLCSDGLRHLVSAGEIREVLADTEMTTDEKASLLIETAKERNERDNITAVVITCEEGEGIALQEDESLEYEINERTTEAALLGHTVKLERIE